MAEMKIQPVVKTPSWVPPGGESYRSLRGTADGAAFTADYYINLALQGRIFYASDGDENDTITGATSFAATTPTLLIDVPAGAVAIPLLVNLRQTGSVAGDNVSVAIAIETAKVRYSTGGTAETNIISSRSDKPVSPSCKVYSAATAATAGTACAIYHDIVAEDVDPASADASRFTVDWRAPVPHILVGPASFLVFTYAGTTGPTWRWVLGWAEIPTTGA